MKKPIILCIVSLQHGNGGKYIATNIAYAIKKYTNKKSKPKITLVDANSYDSSLASNLENKNNLTDLTTQLKFDITKLTLNNEKRIEYFKKIINGEDNNDYIIISTEIENLDCINSLCKNKTNILVVKANAANNKKIDSEIEMLKKEFKYVIINCPEKTVKITKCLKQNNIKIIGRTIYNELTLDNVNIQKSTKIKNIKNIKNFKRIAYLKIREGNDNEIHNSKSN